MSAHIIDSELFGHSFTTTEMSALFSAESVVRSWIDVEVALAKAQAQLGTIPAEAARDIERHGVIESFDLTAMGAGIRATSHTLMAFIQQFQDACDPRHRGYLHWGATTQDIVDTGAVLRFERATALLERDLREIRDVLRDTTHRYADTVMPGRTHGQHALPVTFGYKAAVWFHEVSRHLERLDQLKSRVFVGNLTGAVGTMAFVGESGPEIQQVALDLLGLRVPEICWHSSRDRTAELASWLAMSGATLGKIAKEITSLQKTDVGELEEPFTEGKIGSSTMPQKRNPSTCESIHAKAIILKAQAPLAYEAMLQEHERDKALWQVEWEFLPEMFLLSAGIMGESKHVLGGLVVRDDRMRTNLESTRGFIMAEAVMGALATPLGRDRAHELVYDIAMSSIESGADFGEALKNHDTITQILTPSRIDELLDPWHYAGMASQIAKAV